MKWRNSLMLAGLAFLLLGGCGDTAHPSIDCLWPEGNHRWPGTADFRGSNGYCVTDLQAACMPDQAICIAPEEQTDSWGSRLLFEFFSAH